MPTDKKVLAVIPARWASTRFPGKPIADILGKPMIQWVSEQARKASLVSEVVVATDDQRIYDTVQGFGGKAIITSPDHKSGTDRAAEVAKNFECDIVVNVQGDEPLISPTNIDRVIRPLFTSSDTFVSTLMIAIKNISEIFDPNICKVVVNNKGHALYFTRAPIPYNRDSWPVNVSSIKDGDSNSEVCGFKHIGIYAYTRSFILQIAKMQISRLEHLEKLEQLRILDNGYTIRVIETDENSICVDRPEDLDIVKNIMTKTL